MGPGMYRVIWGPAWGQYHPRLNPLMKATPLAQPGIAMKESGRMPSLDFRAASAVKVPLHDEEEDEMRGRKNTRKGRLGIVETVSQMVMSCPHDFKRN